MTKDIKERLRRYAKNPKGVMLEPTLEDAAERIEELEAENTELKAQIADINDMLAMAERAGR